MHMTLAASSMVNQIPQEATAWDIHIFERIDIDTNKPVVNVG